MGRVGAYFSRSPTVMRVSASKGGGMRSSLCPAARSSLYVFSVLVLVFRLVAWVCERFFFFSVVLFFVVFFLLVFLLFSIFSSGCNDRLGHLLSNTPTQRKKTNIFFKEKTSTLN